MYAGKPISRWGDGDQAAREFQKFIDPGGLVGNYSGDESKHFTFIALPAIAHCATLVMTSDMRPAAQKHRFWARHTDNKDPR